MVRLQRLIDRVFAILKWPAALLALIMVPGTCSALYELARWLAERRDLYLPFVGGALGYLALWRYVLRHPAWGSLLPTFEHELTHALFAWATLHPVVGFRATWRSGGHIHFRGEGNWLITIAPYFFPTASVAAALLIAWAPSPWQPWMHTLLGATVSYHLISTWREIHRRQPDLQRTGFTFAFLYLPAANLLWYGLVIAFAFGGLDATEQFVRTIYDHSVELGIRAATRGS